MEHVGAIRVDVASAIVGAQQQEPALPIVSLTLVSERIAVRELVRRAVIAQVHALLAAHGRANELARRLLARQYMTQAEVEELAREGRVAAPVVRAELELDVELEVERALRGFERRAFRVVVDGEMLLSLDDQLTLTPHAKVTFLRMIPLVGG